MESRVEESKQFVTASATAQLTLAISPSLYAVPGQRELMVGIKQLVLIELDLEAAVDWLPELLGWTLCTLKN